MSSSTNNLGDIADVVDSLHKTPSYVENGFPMVRVTDVKYGDLDLSKTLRVNSDVYEEFSRRYKPNRGDVIITRVGTYGVFGKVLNTEFCLGQNTAAIVPKNLSPDYLYAVLNSKFVKSQIESAVVGSTQKTLSLKAIKALQIPRLELAQERAIGKLIKEFDDRIKLLREANATLEAIAQALFKSWFVDFDPVRAKSEGKFPEGMDEATVALFPDAFEETELGMMPKGWQVGIISDLGEVICGKTPATSKSENYGDDVPFITIPDMHNRLVITSTGRSLSMIGANSQKKKTLPPGSVSVSCIATPGLVSQVTRESQTNQQINSVIPYSRWGKSYPLFLLRRIGDAVRAAGSGGSVFHNLNKTGFEAIKILLTSVELAQKFNEIVTPLMSRIESNQMQADTLDNLRDTLLPRLISGQLGIADAEVELEKVTA